MSRPAAREPGATIPARDHRTRSLALRCGSCGTWTERQLSGGEAPPATLRCRACCADRPVDFAPHLDARGALDGCPACGFHTLAIQKDVNPKLGLLVVVVTFGALILLRLTIPQLLAGLLLLAALDWLLLAAVVRRFLMCYRCKAQFRGFPPGASCRPFDLATWEAHSPPGEG